MSISEAPAPIIEARGVEFAYGAFPVLCGVDLTVVPGEVAAFTGDNGCGKSTLLKILIGQNRPTGGSVRLFGEETFTGSGAVASGRLRGIGYVPQTNVVNKISFPITSRELVVQGLARDFGFVKVPRRRHYEHADELLDHMGLGEFAPVPFGELSGGLQQRVLIARALIDDPRLVVLDEPTVGVDKRSLAGFLHQLDRLREEKGLTIVMVSHELETVTSHMQVDSVYVMKEGLLCHA
ncbi:ATP-binding cassette domain-containing protein [Corynebacterium sp. MSK039]|uniref:metal ABC transporter ATP-binding protein n=1 Tax=Corynebacterium sp. MSK039 TaxID=3050193 RepID=UPI00254AD47E|nr:ATP-binding cassette domain-containing protein [Corynebacterium sp. MSK039]MDK8790298.1 ATP-binding cassette domain-containing protein [Corynebacterium sp. MSK039]